MKQVLLAFVLGGLLVLGASTVSAQDGTFTPSKCPFDIPAVATTDIECGYLTVPQNRADPSSGTIELAVAILNSRSATPAPDPIFFLEGGPGGTALLGVDVWYELPLLDTRDMILFDQRGTGFSQPNLDCPGIEETQEDQLDMAINACRQRFINEGVDLNAYTSAESAADANALRTALGYEQVNLLGISYGTRLGLTIMRDYPEMVRAAILDSVYPPNANTNYESVPELWGMLNGVFDDCTSDAACNAAFPDLRNRFFTAVDGLAATGNEPESGEPFEFDELYVLGQTYQQFFNGQAFSAPAAFDALADGDYDIYLELAILGADPGLPGGAAVAADASLLEELIPEEVTQLEGIVATGNEGAVVDFFMSLFDGTAADFQPLAAALVAGEVLPDGSMSEGMDGDMDFDAVAEADFLLAELTDDEYFAVEDQAFAGDQAGIETFLLESFDMDDATASVLAGAIVAVITGEGLEDFEAMGEGGEMAAENDGDSYGMNLSVQCAEELPFLDSDTGVQIAEQAGVDADFIDATFAFNEFADCAVWDVQPSPAFENDAVVSDIPTLLFSGQFDPATPPAWGDLAAESLSTSTHIVFPRQGHSLITSIGPCPGEIAQAFLSNPSAPPPTTCADNFNQPFFIP